MCVAKTLRTPLGVPGRFNPYRHKLHAHSRNSTQTGQILNRKTSNQTNLVTTIESPHNDIAHQRAGGLVFFVFATKKLWPIPNEC